jgi:hypothetical protein
MCLKILELVKHRETIALLAQHLQRFQIDRVVDGEVFD